MSTLRRLSDSLGISQSISYLISNTQSGIDSIAEAYDALSADIDYVENLIYGLSASITSTSGTSGISGANGSSGTSGTSGISGANGSSGTSGINGATGPAGSSFIPVLSASEIFRGQTHRNNSTTIDTHGAWSLQPQHRTWHSQ